MLGRPTSINSGPISRWLNRGPGPAQRSRDSPLFSSNWVDYDGKTHTEELDLNCHCCDSNT